MDANILNGVTLAYMGDVVWSLYIREYLILSGYTKANDLQKKSVKWVSAKGQAKLYYQLEEEHYFSDEESEIFKRGRNAKTSSSPKNTDVLTYHISTGFEALIGWLYLHNQHERIKQIYQEAITRIK